MPAVSPSYKTARVAAGNVARSFDRHAQSYDMLVGANPGYHEHLRMSTQRMGLPNRGAGLRLLDLGCGTGASTAALLDAAPEADVVEQSLPTGPAAGRVAADLPLEADAADAAEQAHVVPLDEDEARG